MSKVKTLFCNLLQNIKATTSTTKGLPNQQQSLKFAATRSFLAQLLTIHWSGYNEISIYIGNFVDVYYRATSWLAINIILIVSSTIEYLDK